MTESMYPYGNWFLEKVKTEQEVTDFHRYRITPASEQETDVELGKVVGTDNARYNWGTWEEVKPYLKDTLFTEEQYLDMVRSPSKYAGGPEPIRMKRYGEEYILCQSGCHRVFYGKFARLSTVRAIVETHVLDPSL